MGNTQDLAAVRTKVNIAFPQRGDKLAHPYGLQSRGAMWTYRIDIVFDFEFYHFGDYDGNNRACK
ncbi:MAG: hypothetical protein JW715_16950 [Sedimentisphaerales bacterium]|nr:hypothetical protein [Sedimentisphaerales bacterium]